MSDNKKYYYLRVKENFYDSDEMIILESMPDGFLYSNILIKLYLRSLKNNGKLMFNDRIPFNSEMLSKITRHPVAVVEKAISIFKEMNLIDVLDNGAIFMLDIESFIGKSNTEADRKREYRRRIEKEKQLLITGHLSGQMSDEHPPELEIELETDIEKELHPEEAGDHKNIIFTKLKEAFGEMAINGTVYEEVNDLVKTHGSSLVIHALDETILNAGRSIRYTRAILDNWQGRGLRTVEQVKSESKKNKKPKGGNKAMNDIGV
nr:MAG TPA: DnaD like replication protein [Caudoviricetes sp.]